MDPSPTATPTVSRPEVEVVERAFERSPGGVLLIGPSGVGKSTILDSVLAPTTRMVGPLGLAGPGRDGDAADDGDVRVTWRCDAIDRVDPRIADELAHRCLGGDRLALTVRSVEQLPASIAALWTDGWLEPVRVDPLPLDVLGRHLAAMLGGPADHGTLLDLRRATCGDLRLLHSLLADARSSGRIFERRGVWTRSGPIQPGRATADLVAADLGRMDRDARAAIELVALAEPTRTRIFLDVLTGLGHDPDSLDRLIRSGDVTEQDPESVLEVRQPIVAETIRRTTTPSRRRNLLDRYRDATSELDGGTADPGRVRWMIQCGEEPSEDELRSAASAAADAERDRLVVELAGRLVDRSEESGTIDVEARLLRAHAARVIGRIDLARRDLAAVDDAATDRGDPALRLTVASRRADLLQYVDDDPEQAMAIMERELDRADPATVTAIRADLAARAGWAGMFDRSPDIDDLLRRPDLDPVDRLRVAPPAAIGLTARGRFRAALDLLEDQRAVLAEHGGGARWADVELLAVRFLVLLRSGRLDDASGLLAVAELDSEAEPSALRHLGRGRVAATRGLWGEAVGHMRIAVESLRNDDLSGHLPVAIADCALAEASAGHIERARQLHAEGPTIPLRTSRSQATTIALTRARAAVVLGLEGAPDEIDDVIDASARRGEALVELEARHLRCLIRRESGSVGDPGEELHALRACAALVDGPIGPALAAHAEAMLLGQEPAAPASAVAACGVLLPSGGRATPLTPRQGEVAHLAAAGMSNRQIAGHLYLSVRTVDAHMRQVFMVLGINRRRDLADALASTGAGRRTAPRGGG